MNLDDLNKREKAVLESFKVHSVYRDTLPKGKLGINGVYAGKVTIQNLISLGIMEEVEKGYRLTPKGLNLNN